MKRCQISFSVDERERRDFQRILFEDGKKQAAVLRQYIKRIIEAKKIP